MSSISDFLAVVDRFCEARGISEARASTIILNGGSRIASIRSGASDIGSRRLEEAVKHLSDHWPEGAEWPNGVERPDPTSSAAVILAPGEAAA